MSVHGGVYMSVRDSRLPFWLLGLYVGETPLASRATDLRSRSFLFLAPLSRTSQQVIEEQGE